VGKIEVSVEESGEEEEVGCFVTSFGASCMVSWNCSMHLCKRNVGGASHYQHYCGLLALVVLLSDPIYLEEVGVRGFARV